MRLPNGENASISRAGITLIEILISIMILGVGLVSLATLFPIGLLRLRDAQRQSRSAYLFESAAADLASRGLLSKATFINPAISPWYITAPSGSYDPWIQDTPDFGNGPLDWAGGGNNPQGAGVYRGLGGTGSAQYNTQLSLNALPPIPGPGLPVAYDPLWRFFTYSPTSGRNGFASTQSPPATVRDGYFLGLEPSEARFGNGIGLVRPNGDPLDGNPPNAWGLQRLTNLNPQPHNLDCGPWDVRFTRRRDLAGPHRRRLLRSLLPTPTACNQSKPGAPGPEHERGGAHVRLALHMDVHWAAIRRLQRHEL